MRRRTLLAATVALAAPAAVRAASATTLKIERQFWIDVPYVPLGAMALPTAYSATLAAPRSGILQAYDVARRT